MNPFLELCPGPPDWNLSWPDLEPQFPWLVGLRNVPQDPVHHREGDVGRHTRLVCEALVSLTAWRDLPETQRWEIFAAALLHDAAKPVVTRTEDNGRVTSRNHSRLGSIMARQLLWRLGVPTTNRERISFMVLHHMAPLFALACDDIERRLITMSWRVNCQQLSLLAEADARGRHCDDPANLLEQVELYRVACEELGCLEQPYPFASAHSRFLYFRLPARHPRYHAFDDTRGQLTLLSGLPGAGKDHWLSRHGENQPVISLDHIRRELGVRPRENQGPVAATARERARVILRTGADFVWNATNISRQQRQRVINLVADYGYRIRIVRIEAAAEVLGRRNLARQRPVPEQAINRMLQRWETPDLTEAHELITFENSGTA